MSEPLIGLLAELPSAELDPVRDERIRMRCRARLARKRPPAFSPTIRSAQVWQPLIAILGAAYLTEVILLALRVSRFP